MKKNIYIYIYNYIYIYIKTQNSNYRWYAKTHGPKSLTHIRKLSKTFVLFFLQQAAKGRDDLNHFATFKNAKQPEAVAGIFLSAHDFPKQLRLQIHSLHTKHLKHDTEPCKSLLGAFWCFWTRFDPILHTHAQAYAHQPITFRRGTLSPRCCCHFFPKLSMSEAWSKSEQPRLNTTVAGLMSCSSVGCRKRITIIPPMSVFLKRMAATGKSIETYFKAWLAHVNPESQFNEGYTRFRAHLYILIIDIEIDFTLLFYIGTCGEVNLLWLQVSGAQ